MAQKKQENKEQEFDKLDVTSQQIINILEEYVKPAVAADGGNIAFDSFNEETKVVKVILQGACGCPSSTFTLKSGMKTC
jgi:Fe-S cluster biogenesis protein NfuA